MEGAAVCAPLSRPPFVVFCGGGLTTPGPTPRSVADVSLRWVDGRASGP
nr:MAG TPA: Interleukin-13 [Caudoviricetes sp.]